MSVQHSNLKREVNTVELGTTSVGSTPFIGVCWLNFEELSNTTVIILVVS